MLTACTFSKFANSVVLELPTGITELLEVKLQNALIKWFKILVIVSKSHENCILTVHRLIK